MNASDGGGRWSKVGTVLAGMPALLRRKAEDLAREELKRLVEPRLLLAIARNRRRKASKEVLRCDILGQEVLEDRYFTYEGAQLRVLPLLEEAVAASAPDGPLCLWPRASLERLSASGRPYVSYPGETVVYCGDTGDSGAWLLLRGTARCAFSPGTTLPGSTGTAPRLFAATSLLAHRPRRRSVASETRCLWLLLSREHILAAAPEAGVLSVGRKEGGDVLLGRAARLLSACCGVHKEVLREVAMSGKLRCVEAGEDVFAVGEPVEGAVLVVSGALVVGGRERGPGAVLGLSCVLPSPPIWRLPVTASAASRVELWSVAAQTLRETAARCRLLPRLLASARLLPDSAALPPPPPPLPVPLRLLPLPPSLPLSARYRRLVIHASLWGYELPDPLPVARPELMGDRRHKRREVMKKEKGKEEDQRPSKPPSPSASTSASDGHTAAERLTVKAQAALAELQARGAGQAFAVSAGS